MPVWGEVISPHQVDDLVAYIHAGLPEVPTATPAPIPQDQGAAVEGAALYVRYGCINCHGPNGLGGVPNPQSPGQDHPAALRPRLPHGVQHRRRRSSRSSASGSVLGRAPIVSMPHWGGIIPETQLQALAAYIETLK